MSSKPPSQADSSGGLPDKGKQIVSKNKPKEKEGHPFQDTTGRFPLDFLLRSHGFKIHERKGKKEALWMWGRKIFPQREALRYMDPDAIKDCEYMQDIYWDLKEVEYSEIEV